VLPDAAAVAVQRRRIAEIAEGATFPRLPNLNVTWLPKIARFSLATARV